MASNENSPNSPPQGLGQPLVTVSNVSGSGIRPSTGGITPATTPAGADHPLANFGSPPPPPPPPPAMTTPSSSTAFPATAPTMSTTPPSAVPQPAVAASPVPTPNVRISNRPVSPQMKSLDNLADQFMAGSSYRMAELKLPPLLKPPPLPPNETGIARLRTLVKRRAWGDVLQVSGDMLRSAQSPHASTYTSLVSNNETYVDTTPLLQQETVEILTFECNAWLKLRRYTDLGKEMEKWSFSRINDVTAVPPTWVPPSVLILAAVSLQFTDSNSQRCIDELYALRELMDEDQESTLSIDSALSNVFVRQKEWRMALQSLDNMLEILPQVHKGDVVQALQAEIWSRQGRILLQVGAIDQAEQVFARATPVPNHDNSNWIIAKIPAQMALQQGMVQFSRKNFNEAMNAFKQASDVLRTIPEPTVVYNGWVESPQCLMTQTWNNMGLCALYTCRMKEAVRVMESLVREDPTLYLTERLAFNLCTLYELGTDTTSSARKKRVLQQVAKRFYLHDIGPEQFRVT